MASLPVLRQSAAELLAVALVDLFPGAFLVECQATEMGFYCEIAAAQQIDIHVLPLIEETLRALVKQDLEVRTLEMMREVASTYLAHQGQPYRAGKVAAAQENIVRMIQVGEFCNYCPLPHVSRTLEVQFFKLLKVEEAVHYLSDEGPIRVKRIHGIVSSDKQDLKQTAKAVQAGSKADHTRLPGGMELFSYHEEVSDHAWIWQVNGTRLKKILVDWWEDEHRKQGFSLLSTPSLIKESWIAKTGILEDARAFPESGPPFVTINGACYLVATSPVASHLAIFLAKKRKEEELPYRTAECFPVALQKTSGLHWGVFESSFGASDFAYSFCSPVQLEAELISSLQFIEQIVKIFDFESHWYFAGCRKKYTGTPKHWEKAGASFVSAFEKCGIAFEADDEDSVRDGPIAEARLIDRFGRQWKGPVVALNLRLAASYGLRYEDHDGKEQTPFLIVRTFFGSTERFIAMLLEHTSGLLPLWLAPEQARVVPVRQQDEPYAKQVCQALCRAGCRAAVGQGNGKVGDRVARAEREKVPYVIIVGEKEENERKITVRCGSGGPHEKIKTVEEFLKQFHEKISSKAAGLN